ncbi:Uncharacterized protein TCM_014282 [Theobroma cacao]|uniref:Uncharacterized protein n=1 Tax=Theobroma cacao TaxID=3641 RepID=A0A061G4Y0_THECC|nr:Uncharacterized protein TCM_014282 [Theobroma cacao]
MEGYRAKKNLEREDRIQAPPDKTRVGCKAIIYIEDEKTSRTNVLTNKNGHEDVASKDHESHFLSQNITLLNPSHVTTKGCPQSLRMKGALK